MSRKYNSKIADKLPGNSIRTRKAIESGELTQQEIDDGWFINGKGKKVQDASQWKKYDEAFSEPVENKEKPTEPTKPTETNSKSPDKNYEEQGAQTIEKLNKSVGKYLSKPENSIKPTVKLSPWFWDNINEMTSDSKAKVSEIDNVLGEVSSGKRQMSEEDLANLKTLRKKLNSKLGGERAKLYADHILNALANVALTTANWTGAEAGHNPNYKMKDSLVDNYKKQNIENLNKQMETAAEQSMKRQVNYQDALDKGYNEAALQSFMSDIKKWTNNSKYRDTKGNIDYKKMLNENLDINSKEMLEAYLKEHLANVSSTSDAVSVLKDVGITEVGKQVLPVIEKAINKAGNVLGGIFEWLGL
jgi:hypothetical protein